jgi:cytochrome c peroxidase
MALIVVPATLGVVMFAATGDTRGVSLLPDVSYPASNPHSEEKRVLGKILFYDEQISSDNTVSCATCHTQVRGGADARTSLNPGPDGVDNTDDDIFASAGVIYSDENNDYAPHPVFGLYPQVTGRAAPSVINAAFLLELFWDGRASDVFIDPETGEIIDAGFAALETQAVGPPLSDVEMSHHQRDWPEITAKLAHARPLAMTTDVPPDMADAVLDARTYPELFRRAFGDSNISAARIGQALATYQRTLISDQSPWDQYVLGDAAAMSDIQRRGMDLFVAERCNFCHIEPFFTDGGYANIGLRPIAEDSGRQQVTGDPADRGRFKTPGLRNTGLKTSFMHNGELSNLAEVVDFYASNDRFFENIDGSSLGFNLNTQQRADLVAFMETGLTDPRVAQGLFPFDAPTLYFNPANTPNPSLMPNTGIPGPDAVTPRIIAVTPPLIGSDDFKVGLTDVPAGSLAELLVSANPPVNGSIDPDRVFGPMTAESPTAGDPTAVATAHWAVPFSPALDGQVYYMQWRVVHPGSDQPAYSPVARYEFFCGFGDCQTGCLADLNRDQALNINDLLDFLQAYNSQSETADLAPPLGTVNFFDLLEFVAAFNAGCP